MLWLTERIDTIYSVLNSENKIRLLHLEIQADKTD